MFVKGFEPSAFPLGEGYSSNELHEQNDVYRIWTYAAVKQATD